MKNIKVNIINIQGKKTSTTINMNICSFYYQFCVSDAEKDISVDEFVALRKKSIQDFVNQLIDEVISTTGMKGVNQSQIEIKLLNKIRNS